MLILSIISLVLLLVGFIYTASGIFKYIKSDCEIRLLEAKKKIFYGTTFSLSIPILYVIISIIII